MKDLKPPHGLFSWLAGPVPWLPLGNYAPEYLLIGGLSPFFFFQDVALAIPKLHP